MKSETLTRVHAETLELLFKGLTYSEIAAVRHRARSTVDHTVEALQELTGTHNARELIYEALARGWITPPARLA